MKNQYTGHSTQYCGVEEHRLVGGKGDGMRLYELRNGLGLHVTVSLDRGADISRLSFKGDNYGYFSPCGYVAPSYYDDKGTGFLKSFTAGFLTTCGLTAVGAPTVDQGQELPLHGTISNTPSEYASFYETEEEIQIHAVVNQSGLFCEKLSHHRTIRCSKKRNRMVIEDEIENEGDETTPLMILYHINVGYPLLSEKSQLYIPSRSVRARTVEAEKGIGEWNVITEPQKHYKERCYYHDFASGSGIAAIFNPEIRKGLCINFDTESLDYFTQWKLFGYRDYVLGLEPGNCHPDGRDVMRREKKLKFIRPNEKIKYRVQMDFFDSDKTWVELNR